MTDGCHNLSLESHSWIPPVKVCVVSIKINGVLSGFVLALPACLLLPLLTHHTFCLYSRCEKMFESLIKVGAVCHLCVSLLPFSILSAIHSFIQQVLRTSGVYWVLGWGLRMQVWANQTILQTCGSGSLEHQPLLSFTSVASVAVKQFPQNSYQKSIVPSMEVLRIAQLERERWGWGRGLCYLLLRKPLWKPQL